VNNELKYLPQRQYGTNTGDFTNVKREVQQLPAAPAPRAAK
jgi:hypothetical protein